MIKTKPRDGVVGAVAANNLAVLREGGELFDSHKRLRSAATDAVEAKLLPAQLEAIRFNRCLLLLRMGKLDESRTAAAALTTQCVGGVGCGVWGVGCGEAAVVMVRGRDDWLVEPQYAPPPLPPPRPPNQVPRPCATTPDSDLPHVEGQKASSSSFRATREPRGVDVRRAGAC